MSQENGGDGTLSILEGSVQGGARHAIDIEIGISPQKLLDLARRRSHRPRQNMRGSQEERRGRQGTAPW